MPTNVEAYSESGMDQTEDITEVFGILKRYLRMCGYYYKIDAKDGKSAFKYKALMIVYCVFCNACAIFNAIRFVFVYDNVSKYSANLITSLAYITFHIEVAISAITATYSLPKNFNCLLKLFRSRYKEHSLRCPNLKVSTRVSYCVVLCLALLCHVGRKIIQKTIFPSIPRFDPPFDRFSDSYKWFWVVLDIIFELFGSLGFYILIIVYNVISYCIFKEFSIFSSKFKSLLHGPKDVFELKFPELWNEHVIICDVLQQVEKCLKHFVAITYLTTMPIFCFLVYGLLKGRLPKEEFGFVAFIFIMCISQIANVTLFGVFVNDKAHEPLQHIFRSSWTAFSDGTIQKISLFVTKISVEKVGYSVYGLFIIDRSTILMVCGTILTYAVVVLQFQPDTDSGCGDGFLNLKNLTNISS